MDGPSNEQHVTANPNRKHSSTVHIILVCVQVHVVDYVAHICTHNHNTGFTCTGLTHIHTQGLAYRIHVHGKVKYTEDGKLHVQKHQCHLSLCHTYMYMYMCMYVYLYMYIDVYTVNRVRVHIYDTSSFFRFPSPLTFLLYTAYNWYLHLIACPDYEYTYTLFTPT